MCYKCACVNVDITDRHEYLFSLKLQQCSVTRITQITNISKIGLADWMEIYLGIILSGSLCVGMATGNFCNCLACSNKPLRLWE